MTDRPEELTRLSTRILLALAREPLHGYGILKELESQEGMGEPPKTGSLYVALQRLGEEGLIAEAPAAGEEEDGRRRYWAITDRGSAALRAEVGRLRRLAALAAERQVVGPGPAPEGAS